MRVPASALLALSVLALVLAAGAAAKGSRITVTPPPAGPQVVAGWTLVVRSAPPGSWRHQTVDPLLGARPFPALGVAG